ncbi:hypothetical protein GQ43DRAFT_481437 [Delitschia confertaspora ATCC 74209]|uniref:Zn(2)-C6 fungal-type domain-containing protein n=1 Tax=Delitschia confertaspora ATCC 74209 TaxID=1513339 RepID=A0A9P4JLT1_9PLEO|nr:hypothetical protein GQ43DRAFT_481437 [Delitschia confertaspora ATCC 74209]
MTPNIHQTAEGVDSSVPGRIQTWLNGVEEGCAPMIEPLSVTSPSSPRETSGRDDSRPQPQTPHRRPNIQHIQDEWDKDRLSPTYSNFSDANIFDTPTIPPKFTSNKQSNDGGGVCSISSRTTISDLEDVERKYYQPGSIAAKAVRYVTLGTSSDCSFSLSSACIQSPNSHHPPTVPDYNISRISSEPIDPNKTYLVHVFSCLQCTLANLTCSRTLPACSRCIRKDCWDVCLLQRRKLNVEYVSGDFVNNTTPKLLRVKNEGDKAWARKLDVRDELIESWNATQDRKNWVLPVNNYKLGNFKNDGYKKDTSRHPGRGIGRMAHAVMKLEFA